MTSLLRMFGKHTTSMQLYVSPYDPLIPVQPTYKTQLHVLTQQGQLSYLAQILHLGL
jgi:hypothetical protein